MAELQDAYSPENFMASSPLFKYKNMTIKTVNYKGNEIKEMSIGLPAVTIIVWDYVNVPHRKIVRLSQENQGL